MNVLDRDFLLTNLWWICLIVLIVLVICLYLIDRLIEKHKREKKGVPATNTDDTLKALGGRDNVLSHVLTGSRIVLVLVDKSKLDRHALEQTGITGFIEKSDQITMVAKDAKEAYRKLFGE